MYIYEQFGSGDWLSESFPGPVDEEGKIPGTVNLDSAGATLFKDVPRQQFGLGDRLYNFPLRYLPSVDILIGCLLCLHRTPDYLGSLFRGWDDRLQSAN